MPPPPLLLLFADTWAKEQFFPKPQPFAVLKNLQGTEPFAPRRFFSFEPSLSSFDSKSSLLLPLLLPLLLLLLNREARTRPRSEPMEADLSERSSPKAGPDARPDRADCCWSRHEACAPVDPPNKSLPPAGFEALKRD